ncbi:glycosyl hydrolase, partial [Janthinobacterium sp. BJB412]
MAARPRRPATPATALAAGAAFALLAGCGVPAIDANVAKEQQKAILRTDQFQAAASNDKVSVVVGGQTAVVTTLASNASVRVTLPNTPALIDVASCADGSFAALDFYHRVWRADAAGVRWTAHALAGQWRPLALTCDPANGLWVVGSGSTIAHSGDGGAHWEVRDFKQDAMFNTVQFVDANNAFVTGEFGALYRSTDGGANWQPATPMPAEFYPYAALFVSPSVGYVSGLAGAMLRTRDAGASWDKLDNPSGLPQFGLTRQGASIYSVGAGGSLQRLQQDRWVAIDYGPAAPAYLRAVAAVGDKQLLIAGAAGALRLTTGSSSAKSSASSAATPARSLASKARMYC